MHTNGILLPFLFSCALCLSPISDSYNIKLSKPGQERECGVIPKIKHRKDFHGLLSPFGQSPWQASIFDSRDGSFFCSGTLISSRHVVTSAACLLAISSPSSLEVRLGDWDISSQDSPYETYDHFSTSVNKVVISPDFSAVASWNQKSAVAVLKLDNEVDYMSYPHIAPLCLPSPLPHHHNHKSKRQFYDQCIATGWGAENYLISTAGRKKNSPAAGPESTGDLENQLEPDAVAYLKPVIITGPVILKEAASDNIHKSNNNGNKYETTILVPNLFDSITVSKEIEISESSHVRNGSNRVQYAAPQKTVSHDPRILKRIDPVEEYIDLPEYIDEEEDSEFVETEETISVEATTHKRVSLSTMPKGEESMEVMESQRHQTFLPFHYSSVPEITTEKVNQETPVVENEKSHHTTDDESRLYRHKQKYKQGRLASRSRRRHGERAEHLKSLSDGHIREKRNTGRRFRVIQKKSLSSDTNININMQMNTSTVLKSVKVIFRKNCKHMRSNLPEIISINNYNKDLVNLNASRSSSKSCVRPANENEISNFCMLDIGSPVVCTSINDSPDAIASGNLRHRRNRRNAKILNKIHHISRHVFPTKIKKTDNHPRFKVQERKKYVPTETKMYLTGVITWKESCVNEGDSNFNFRETEVTSIQEILPFLLESMQK